MKKIAKEQQSDKYANSQWRLYEVEPPLAGYRHVIVSKSNVVEETFIFGADKDGEVLDWDALEGSSQGNIDHGEALALAGYSVDG